MRFAIYTMLAIAFLCGSSCTKKEIQPQVIRLTIEGDDSAKSAIEKMIKDNPKIYILESETSDSHSASEYSLQIVEPDSSMNYSILSVEPDPNGDYSIMIYDPKTLDAILKEIKNLNEKVKDK
ncbi:MAG: hypothetical protein U5O15_05195 [Candidatus Krumholzibacteriota bacterium]|nr:hypothetical protein [Candidatus Krumholzibacteriota bacterium]